MAMILFGAEPQFETDDPQKIADFLAMHPDARVKCCGLTFNVQNKYEGMMTHLEAHHLPVLKEKPWPAPARRTRRGPTATKEHGDG